MDFGDRFCSLPFHSIQSVFCGFGDVVGAVFFGGGVSPLLLLPPCCWILFGQKCAFEVQVQVAGVMCWGVSVVEFAVVGMASFDLV